MIYGTGMMLMAAGVFMTVGCMMLMAKERISDVRTAVESTLELDGRVLKS